MDTTVFLNAFALVFGSFFAFAAVAWRRKTSMLRDLTALSQSSSLPALRPSLPLLARELDRSRRTCRPLTCAVLTVRTDELISLIRDSIAVGGKGPAAERRTMQTVYAALALIGCTLRDSVRAADIAVYDAVNRRYVLLMPESGKAEAVRALERIRQLLQKQTGAFVQVGAAEFPSDALTIEDLLAAAEADRVQRETLSLPVSTSETAA